MKQTIADRAIDILLQRRRLVEDKLAQYYKRTKPFRMEQVTGKQLEEIDRRLKDAEW